MKTLWTMAGLAVSLTLGAETVLLDRTAPGGTSIDIALPERAVSDADRAVGEISLWITAGNGYTGWTWALPSRPDDLYLTDGAAPAATTISRLSFVNVAANAVPQTASATSASRWENA